ncbi:MAG: hypothetical protein JNM68_03500 [Dinghuibacter sp.]|nr:hypothetical protein [Dinghuibacter sp.]
MKKAILLYLGYVVVATIIQGCCGNANCISYVELKNGLLRVKINGVYQQTGSYSTTVDTLDMQMDFTREFIAYEQPRVQLMNSAYATKCDMCENGERGLKDKIKTILLTSNQAYLGSPAGNSLNNLFKFYDVATGNITPRLIPLDSLGFFMNRGHNRINLAPVRMASGTKPGNGLPHTLNIRFEFESGKIVNAVSPEFSWN